MTPHVKAMEPDALRLLVVEDEPDLRETTVTFLQLEGFQVWGVNSAAAAEAWLRAHGADIVILDIGLPDQDGITWIAESRKGREVGLIMTTARGELSDRIRGLAAGADAYLVKPVELEELRLVVMNLGHRMGRLGQHASAAWTLDPIRWELRTRAGVLIKLTRYENALLHALATAPGESRTRDELVLALGLDPSSYDPRRMEILTRRLRNKINAQSGESFPIKTVHGYGYAFTDLIAITPS